MMCSMVRNVHQWPEVVLIVVVFVGCSGQPSPPSSFSKSSLLVTIASSADFGCLPSNSAAASRIVKLRNSSKEHVVVSHWAVSCECLSIEPASIDLEPEKVGYIRLLYDSRTGGTGFVGSLLMEVEGFAGDRRVCVFQVPVSLISGTDLTHLKDVSANVKSENQVY